ncbi:MAG: leucine-rich repeat domain-containing protein [Candidatus Thorarchaeota archaeon]
MKGMTASQIIELKDKTKNNLLTVNEKLDRFKGLHGKKFNPEMIFTSTKYVDTRKGKIVKGKGKKYTVQVYFDPFTVAISESPDDMPVAVMIENFDGERKIATCTAVFPLNSEMYKFRSHRFLNCIDERNIPFRRGFRNKKWSHVWVQPPGAYRNAFYNSKDMQFIEKNMENEDLVNKTIALYTIANEKVREFDGFEDNDTGKTFEDMYEPLCHFDDDVKEITFSNKSIGYIPKCMGKYKDLETLDLKDCGIEKIENLEENTGLKKLILRDNDIVKIEGIDNLKELETLDLGRNRIKKIEGLENNTKLRDLDLLMNPIDKIDDLDKNVNLERVDLSHTWVKKIENIGKLAKLRHLDLGSSYIKEIEGLGKNTKLERLGLDYNQIKNIEGLDRLVNLKDVQLNHNKIGKIKCLKFKLSRKDIGKISC